jgi:hypothetical protein
MAFKFELGGAVLEPTEAMMLITTMASQGDSVKLIPLDTIININELNAQTLFDLSIKQKNQALASLAWKVSVSKAQTVPTAKVVAKPEIVSYKKKAVKQTHFNYLPLEDIIEHLNTSTSYCSTGVSMLLKALKQTDSVTLRQVAVNVANEMWNAHPALRNSKFFKGFEFKQGRLDPIVLSSGIDRKHTFHVSPIYIALREGLLYCQSQGLVDKVKLISVGAPYVENPSASVNSTRRAYYKVRPTERGRELLSVWGDIDNYVYKAFQSQKAS